MPFNPNKYLKEKKFEPLKYIKGASISGSFIPEPTDITSVKGARETPVKVEPKEVETVRVPRVTERSSIPDFVRVLANLGLGFVEMQANAPDFFAELIAEPKKITDIPEQTMRPVGKAWGNILNHILGREIPAHFQYTSQEKEELKTHPEQLAQPLLVALGAKSLGKKGWNWLKSKVPKTPEIPVEPDVSVRNVMQALKEAKPLRGKQEKLYTKERGARLAKLKAVREKTSGEKGFYAELKQLKGELPKIEYESIREKISQIDIDNLFDKVKDADILTDWEKITAREGLAKMFGEYGGRIPTRGELDLLNRVFGYEFTKTLLDKRPLLQKMKDVGYEVANLPRAIMASFDLSAPLRQGAFLIGKPKQFIPAFGKMFKAFGSEKAYKAIQADIIRKPSYKLMRQSKLALTEIDARLTMREERFMSNLGEKIPLVGKGIRASNRAYTGFLNKLRADVFDDLVNKARKLGLEPEKDILLSKSIANFVNNATGRGSLGKLQGAAIGLNSFFFSPRLMASRLSLLNPIYYIKQPPFVRIQALKSLLTASGVATTVMGLAKLGGLEIGYDPRNADFGKIKIGKVRHDILAGFGQYIRAGAQIITGKYISSVSGKEVTLGEGYRPLTRLDIFTRQIESKEAPLASFATDLMRGQNWMGEDVKVVKEIGRRFVPMVIGDMIDLAKEDPKLLPLGIPAVFGVGLLTYESYPSEVRKFNLFLSGLENKKRKIKKIEEKKGTKFSVKEKRDFGLILNKRLDGIIRRFRKLNMEIWKINKSNLPYGKKRLKIAQLKNQMNELAKEGLKYKEKRGR